MEPRRHDRQSRDVGRPAIAGRGGERQRSGSRDSETAANAHAFLWTSGGGMVDIGIPGENMSASDINNAGTIAITNRSTGSRVPTLRDR